MNLFRKIFGLGPSEPNNKIKKPNTAKTVKNTQKLKETIIKTTTETSYKFENSEKHTVLPYLISEKTRELNLSNELVDIFHTREDIYSKVLVTITALDDSEDDAEISHLNTKTLSKEQVSGLLVLAYENIEKFSPNELVFWNSSDNSFDFEILTTTIAPYSSEKILSKTEMLKAHEMLQSKELIVSIGRKETIFICGKSNLSEEQFYNFVNLHIHVITSNQSETEILCEDLFLLEEGEVVGSFNIQQVSDLLIEGKIQ